MPNDFDNFSLYVVVSGSGSLRFDGTKRTELARAGGAFSAGFAYTIGSPAANAFAVEIDDDDATVSVSPAAPVTMRQRMGGSPSDMEPVPANEVQAGTVSGTVPANTGTAIVEHTVTLTMTQP